jgi:putative phosphoribosyl transferase
MTHRFTDRAEAGRVLAERLARYARREDVLVLALPRGGVPVGFEIAKALGSPLEVFVVRKLGVPGHEELAMGAIAAGGIKTLNEDLVRDAGISQEQVESVVHRELAELERREREYRGDRPSVEVGGKTVILVDDGLATGSTMRAAVTAVGKLKPRRIVVAVPVGDPSTCDSLRGEADEVECAITPSQMAAISLWYEKFPQTSDGEVRSLLARVPQSGSIGDIPDV